LQKLPHYKQETADQAKVASQLNILVELQARKWRISLRLVELSLQQNLVGTAMSPEKRARFLAFKTAVHKLLLLIHVVFCTVSNSDSCQHTRAN
jgi:hypothetical protein